MAGKKRAASTRKPAVAKVELYRADRGIEKFDKATAAKLLHHGWRPVRDGDRK